MSKKTIDWESIEKELAPGKWVWIEENIYLVGTTYYLTYSNGRQQKESTNIKFVSVKETNIKDVRELLALKKGKVAEGKDYGSLYRKTTFLELVEDLLAYHRTEKTKDMERVELSLKHLLKFFCEMTEREIEYMNSRHKKLGEGCLLEFTREIRAQRDLKDIKARKITSRHVDKYIEARQQLGKGNGTINRELSPLRQMFHLGYIRQPKKVAEELFVPYLKEDNIREGFVEFDEYEAMKELLPYFFKGPYMLGYFSGMRLEELLSLEMNQIIWAERKISLRRFQTKNKEPRIFFVKNNELWDYIIKQKQLKERRYPACKYLFFNKGEKIKNFRTSFDNALIAYKGNIQFRCKKCNADFHLAMSAHQRKKKRVQCPECGNKKVDRNDRLFHDLRRTGVRNLIRSGVSQKTAMLISGHKTDSIFRRYQIIDESDIEEACEKLEEFQQKKKRIQTDDLSKTYQNPKINLPNIFNLVPANTEEEIVCEIPST